MLLLSETSASPTHVEVELLVATTTTSTTTERSSSAAAEEIREDVIKVHVIKLLASASLSLHLFMLSHALFALLVIYSTFLFIRKYFIRVSNLLELLFRAIGVVLILVRMVLNRQFLEPLFDFSIRSISFHAENFV